MVLKAANPLNFCSFFPQAWNLHKALQAFSLRLGGQDIATKVAVLLILALRYAACAEVQSH